MYLEGQGVTKDDKKAVDWFSKAAKQGLLDAHYALGCLYGAGQGVIQSHEIAHMFFSIVAEGGDINAKEQEDLIAKKMTPAQIEQAQTLAQEWIAQYK